MVLMTKGKQIILGGKQLSYAGKMHAHTSVDRKFTHGHARSKLFGQLFIVLAHKMNNPAAL